MDSKFIDMLDDNDIKYEIRGGEVWYQCPLPGHSNQDKNFSASYSLVKNVCNCFVHGGSLIKLIQYIEKCDYKKAKAVSTIMAKQKDKVAAEHLIDDILKPKKELSMIDVFRYKEQIYKPYTFKNFTSKVELIEKLEIGYDKFTKRVTIPVKDKHGLVKFVVKRSINPDAKLRYIYEPKGCRKSEFLYGIDFYDNPKVLIIVEGVKDVIKSMDKGFNNFVAIFGSKMSNTQFKMIKDSGVRKVILALDNDIPGRIGMEKIVNDYMGKLNLYLFKHPKADGRDMADYTKDEIIYGIKNAKNVFSLMIEGEKI